MKTDINSQEKTDQATEQETLSALMLLSSHCAHCPGVLDALTKMIKDGDIDRLEVINLEQNPQAMQHYKVRSVPWVRIGSHELSGAQTLETLKQRAAWARDEQGQNNNQLAEFDHLLSEGQVAKVIDTIKSYENAMQTIMQLLGDSGTVLSTRIGIGVVFEEFAKTPLLTSLIPALRDLTQHEDARIRADAYHYLGLSGDLSVIDILEQGTKDTDAEVSEIALDSLETLQSS